MTHPASSRVPAPFGTPAATRDRRRLAHALIPGGCHTYAKGDDQYPENAPGFIVRGRGSHVWDADGNEYIEYGMGLRAVTLGHAYPPVVAAAAAQLALGSNFTRPAPIEVDCAEKLLGVLPSGDMVKFAKDGSTVVTAALRLARAYTGRDMVAYCADHPFFSYNDWFIGSWRMAAGIPAPHRSLTATFRYNDLESLRAVFAAHPGRVAAVLLEPERETPPHDGFLRAACELAHRDGALFILDEMITGFRWHLGGAQAVYGVEPDLAAFGKALANGFALSALVGKREIMSLGGWAHDRDRVFLLSTTHGAETHALAAAIATIEVYAKEPVIAALHRQGARLQRGCEQVAAELGLAEHVQVVGRPCNLVYVTRDAERKPSPAFRTLFMQELVRHGVLGPSFVVSYSHSDADIDRTVAAVRAALVVYKRGLEDGVHTVLAGRPVRPVDRRAGDRCAGGRRDGAAGAR
jgi:glutamate-1-semialdehyde 2,1-aminomutase